MKINKFNKKFRRGMAVSLGALCCSSIISEAKVDIDLQNLMDDFKLSETDPGAFRIKLKEKTDKLLSLDTIKIDPSFEKLDDKSKYIVISALEKLSEIPLVRQALTYNGTTKTTIQSKSKEEGFEDIAEVTYPDDDKFPVDEFILRPVLTIGKDFFDRESASVYLKGDPKAKDYQDYQPNQNEINYYIEQGKPFISYGHWANSKVSDRLLFALSKTTPPNGTINENSLCVLHALNNIVHETGHIIADYTQDALLNMDENSLITALSKKREVPDIKTVDGAIISLASYLETPDKYYPFKKLNFSTVRYPLQEWIKKYLSSPTERTEPYISNYAMAEPNEYLAELFVHLCGFNLPISTHAKRYADFLKLLHGGDCLGPTVKY